ncbi:MAG TPA: phosphonate C-P lyase system protein PhnH [Hypericibacter adhaerens]|jgi:alpha-D-ribose 1-methylphosphonate 5-triphosphate synthase subunit PhnH|uniref:Carbon-phosphorus lyase subunit PhnH n=1 Tax=Hypericibacter adhaerens TaxID=2602016 RepID=A0A5J6N090_9PROT|nr:phosphonate C-P lyase system protein PhnH [Hypericibacter adhaerens]QEX22010.1 carbon-phosphorus lyase subunit PhnH [Hypericibacter adhaerens]HWA46331.1 phosphonate C-P lyase system protein PhnH [Hypericibacter adhaerens]
MIELGNVAKASSSANRGVLAPGLPDPVEDAQRIFRCALTALSEPGRILQLPVTLRSTCQQLGNATGPAALGLLLALADGDTPVWLDRQASGIATFLAFHTGAPIAGEPMAARFALVADAATAPRLADFDGGSVDHPDRSATLIIEASRLASGGPIGFSGPGIPTRRFLAIDGLPEGFVADWTLNHARFPCGVDVLVTCGDRLVGLPRSTALELSCT